MPSLRAVPGAVRRLPPNRLRPLLVAAAVAATCAPPPPASAAGPRAYDADPHGSTLAQAEGFDVLHYHLALDLTEPARGVRARAELLVVILEPRRDTLALDLVGMRVSGVVLGGAGAEPERNGDGAPAYRHDGRVLSIPLPARSRPGDTLRLAVAYEGSPNDGLIVGQTVHGAPAVFADNWPDRARRWLPSIDHPRDKATVSWEVYVPEGWEVVANGAGGRRVPVSAGGAPLEDEPPLAAGLPWSYRMRVPVPTYAMVIGAADFAIHTVDRCAPGGDSALREDGCVDVTVWAFPPDSAHAARVFRRAGAMIAFYSDLLAPYPYHKLAHVQSATRFGGMENAGAIFYPEGPLAGGADIEPIVAHETAHQWFGNAVTPADWRHLWLSEGFATYFGALFFEHADGEERFRDLLREHAEIYFGSAAVQEPIVDLSRPPAEDLLSLLNANQYQKAGWVLHMLRGLLGDEAFYQGVRRYYDAHVHGNALTEDFRSALEEASGEDLEWFFRQWLYSPGYPVVRLSWTWDDARSVARVTLSQTQAARWPTFRLPLTLAFATAAGEVRTRAELTSRSETFSVSLPARPSGVQVDPDDWLLMIVQER